jgi:hypothetical protein
MLSQNDSVGIVAMIWAGWFKDLGFQHQEGKIVSFLHSAPDWLRNLLSSLPIGYLSVFPGGEVAGTGNWTFTQSSAEINNVYNYTTDLTDMVLD